MLRFALLSLSLILCAVILGGCEKEEEAAFVIKLPEVTVDEAGLAGLPAEHAALVGTTWIVGEYTARFLGPDKVYIGGKPLAEIAPEGLEADYTYKDGRLEISAADKVKTGTWDGDKLVVDGAVGVKQ